MQKILLFATVLMLYGTVFAEQIHPMLMRNLKGFPVMKANLKQGVLTLVTTHGNVSHETYEDVVAEGVCAILEKQTDRVRTKTRINRIEVLSRNGQQGYVFTDAQNACRQLSGITDPSARETFFAGQTENHPVETDDLPP